MPDLLGLHLDPERRPTVTRVDEGSEAAAAGFEPGDHVRSLEGQPLLSIADLQWVLQHAGAPTELRAGVERNGEAIELTLAVPEGWRRRGDFTWRGSIWGLRPGIAVTELEPEQRRAAELDRGTLGLLVTGLHEEWGVVKGRAFDSRWSGLGKNDIIVALDGDTSPRNPSEFIAWFWQNTEPGGTVTVTVLRRGNRVDVDVKLP